MPSPITPPDYSSRWRGPGAIGRYFPGPQLPMPDELSLRERMMFTFNPRLWREPIADQQMTPGGNVFDTPDTAYDGDIPLNRWGQPDIMASIGWDYKNPPINEFGIPVNHEGMELPEGADGFNANGDPYFKSWWEGFVWKATKSKPMHYTDEEEDKLVAEWKPSRSFVDNVSAAWDGDISWLEAARDTWRSVALPVQRAWRDVAVEDEDFTMIGKAGRFMGASLWAGIQGIGAISEGVERGLGAPAMTWKQLAGDRALDWGDWNIRTANFNWIYEMTVAPIWNMFQTFTHGDYDAQKVRDLNRENYQASRIAYSMFQDEALKEEFVRRMKEGEDPDLLAIELQNPWTEMWGLMILDPLNFIGPITKGRRLVTQSGKFAAESAKVESSLAKVLGLDELWKAARNTGKTALDEAFIGVRQAWSRFDETGKAEKFVQLVNAQKDITKNIATKLDDFARATGLNKWTADTKRWIYSHEMADASAWLVANFKRDIDEPFEAMKYVAMLHSDKANDVEAAMTFVLNSEHADVLLSNRFQTFGKVLHDSLLNKEGVFDAAGFLKRLEEAQETGKMEKVLQNVMDTYRTTLDTYFPSLGERHTAVNRIQELWDKAAVADDLRVLDEPSKWKNLVAPVLDETDKIDDLIQVARLGTPPKLSTFAARFDKWTKSNIYHNVNAFYASMYMGLSPGYAIRNFLSNSFHIWIDQGPAAWGKGTLWNSEKHVERVSKLLGGVIPATMFQGMAKPMFAEGAEKVLNWAKPWRLMLDWSQNLEVSAAKRVVGKVVDDVMKLALQEGRALPDAEILRVAGMNDDAVRMFQDLVVRNFGDVDAAKTVFVSSIRNGVSEIATRKGYAWWNADDLDAWDTLRQLFPEFGDDYARAVDSENFEQAADIMNSMKAKLDDIADGIADEPPILPDDYPPDAAEELLSTVDEMSDVTHNLQTSVEVATNDAGNALYALEKQLIHEIAKKPGVMSSEEFLQLVDELGLPRADFELAASFDNPRSPGVSAYRASATKVSRDLTDTAQAVSKALTRPRGDKWKATLSDKFGEPITKLEDVWNKIRMFDEPFNPAYTMKDVKNYLWEVAHPNKRNAIWMSVLEKERDHLSKLNQLADFVFGDTTTMVSYSKRVDEVVAKQNLAKMLSESSWVENIGAISLRDRMYSQLKDRRFPDAIRTLAMRYGIATRTSNMPGAHLDRIIVNIWNKYSQMIELRTGLTAAESSVLDNFDDVKEFVEMMGSASGRKEVLRMTRGNFGDLLEPEALQAIRAAENDIDRAGLVQEILMAVKNELAGAESVPAYSGYLEDLSDLRAALHGDDLDVALTLADDLRKTLDENWGQHIDALHVMAREGAARKIKSIEEINSEEMFGLLHNLLERRAQSARGQKSLAGYLGNSPADDAKRIANGLNTSPLPSAYAGGTPTPPRVIYEQLDGYKALFDRITNGLGEVWDRKTTTVVDDVLKKAIDEYATEAKARIGKARIIASDVASAAREFTLLDYNKKGGMDLLAGYMFPYHYWYSRTYANWMKRVTQHPGVVAAYDKYRDALSNINAGAPEWWRYNLRVNSLPGLDLKNPLFFNLEATLNPLQGLLGVDFNDPEKRVDYWSRLLDDIGKIGPSVWTPYQLMTAFSLYMRGEKEAASRWAGRFIPQTAVVRAIGGLAGQDWEIDPFVQVLGGGYDAYERGRIGRALGSLSESGMYTEEAVIDAAKTQEGEVWDAAVRLALSQRSGGQLASFLLGVGFKARTQSEMAIDAFYRDYRRLWALEGNMSPNDLRTALDDMRETYPFMDALLISRKSGLEQDRGISYNVLGRIPPGMTNDVAELVGIDGALLDKFYSDKGHIEDWVESDRNRFMAAIVDIGAILALPDNATREEWTAVRNAYRDMRTQGEQLFGKEVWDYVDLFYSAAQVGDEEEVKKLRDSILNAYPEVGDALDYRSQSIMQDPLLYDYYGGIDFVEKYWTGRIYDELYKLYPNIGDMWDQYFSLKEQDDAQLQALRDAGKSTRGYKHMSREYWDNHPQLQGYIDLKDARMSAMTSRLAALGNYLRAGGQDTLRLRSDLPQNIGVFQQELLGQYQQGPTWSDYEGLLGQEASSLMLDYFMNGEEMPPVLVDHLISVANAMGVDVGTLVNQLYGAYSQEAVQYTVP